MGGTDQHDTMLNVSVTVLSDFLPNVIVRFWLLYTSTMSAAATVHDLCTFHGKVDQ